MSSTPLALLGSGDEIEAARWRPAEVGDAIGSPRRAGAEHPPQLLQPALTVPQEQTAGQHVIDASRGSQRDPQGAMVRPPAGVEQTPDVR
jgi:hypothetical protein